MEFVAYHDRTGQDHQAQFKALYPQGYRMISLSVYQPAAPLYAAVWVLRPGPDWSAVHGVDGAQYQAAFNTAAAAGTSRDCGRLVGSLCRHIYWISHCAR